MFYNGDMQDISQHDDEDVSHTDHQRTRDSSAIDGNAESYKTSSTHEFSEIFSNREVIKTVTFEYLTRHNVGLPVADRKNQLFEPPRTEPYCSKHYTILRNINFGNDSILENGK